MHTGSQNSFGGEDDERLVSNGCWAVSILGSEDDQQLVSTDCGHSFWSEDRERLILAAVGTRSGGSPESYSYLAIDDYVTLSARPAPNR